MAFEYAKRSGLDVVTVCPSLVLGTILQSTINASSLVLIKFLKGKSTGLAHFLIQFSSYLEVKSGCSMDEDPPISIP